MALGEQTWDIMDIKPVSIDNWLTNNKAVPVPILVSRIPQRTMMPSPPTMFGLLFRVGKEELILLLKSC